MCLYSEYSPFLKHSIKNREISIHVEKIRNSKKAAVKKFLNAVNKKMFYAHGG